MKKLLINLLLAVLLNCFISAAANRCNSVIKASNITKIDLYSGGNSLVEKEVKIEIHPLDILALKF